jgi:hypothetical protein
MAMLPEIPADIQEALDLGIALFVGEAEGRLDQVLQDAYAGSLKPQYNYMNDLPDIAGAPIPILRGRTHPHTATHARQANGGRIDQFRRGARLPVPMLVLHDH